MRTNGYRVIDFKGENLVEGSVPGIFARVDNCKKPLVFSNFCFGDSDEIQSPFFAGFGVKGTYSAGHYEYVYFITTDAEGSIFSLSIKDDDTIAITTP